MSNDSTTGGFLVPIPAPAPYPLEDAAIDALFQQLIVGLTGMSGTLVRPRWQIKPVNQPAVSVDWISIGIRNQRSDDFAFVKHVEDFGNGQSGEIVERQEEIDLAVSVYGPNCQNNASLIRDGLSVDQNRYTLQQAGMGLINVGDIRNMPEKYNELWYKRVDFIIYIRRVIVRTYPIVTLLSSSGTISDGVKNASYQTKGV